MKIAVIGAGNVGGALSRLWSAAGHQVTTATRQGNPTPPEAAKNAEIVALCVPGVAAEQAAASCGDVSGKILIDCTNPLAPDLGGLVYGGTTSTAELLQQAHPTARVVKAFNTLGAGLLGLGKAGDRHADGFYCGDDPASKHVVDELVSAAGLRPVDVGGLRNARYLEAMAMLWIDLAVNQKLGVSFTFNLVTHQQRASV